METPKRALIGGKRIKEREWEKTWRVKLKLETLKQYGECCQCCGESWPVFLSIDHIDGNGAAHRKSIGGKWMRGGGKFYIWLKQRGFPPGYQVLCLNCNRAKHDKGVCPHQSTTGRNAHAPIPTLAHDNRLAPRGSSLPEDASSGA